jgi:glycosyltransferase involved in cell wall biosynthesis
MNIIFLNVSGHLGGAERILIDVLHSLRDARPDWRLEVIVGEDGPLIPTLMEAGFEVSVLPYPERLASLGDAGAGGLFARMKLMFSLALALPAILRYRRQLRGHLAQLAPGAVHTNGFKMHLLGAMTLPKGARLICHIHDFVRSRPLVRRLLAHYSHIPAAYIAISRSVAADLRAVVKRPERVHTILNALNLQHFSPSGPVTDLDSLCGVAPRPDAVRIGLVATFARWKGHEVFLRALAALSAQLPCRAFIIGGEVYRTAGSQYTLDQILAQAESLGVAHRVHFTGFLADTAAAMRNLDIVVHASTEPEPFGLVIAEAMACGRAVIASLGGGATEIINPGVNGLGHVPGDVAQLANCIERLVLHPELRRAYGNAARRSAESLFRRERLAEQLIPIYTAS